MSAAKLLYLRVGPLELFNRPGRGLTMALLIFIDTILDCVHVFSVSMVWLTMLLTRQNSYDGANASLNVRAHYVKK
ncbi:hypothetical protein [Aliiglaciecola litoralis]|uniref:RDD family protein n=1 Tax=Aliiglaciecola litoralis TaxID=582857 RepID=A0ABP3X600_9ALTE